MKVYKEDDHVIIIGRDAAIRIWPEDLVIAGHVKDQMIKHGATKIDLVGISSKRDVIRDYEKSDDLVAYIPDVTYEVGKQYPAELMGKNPPPNGTIVKTFYGRPMEYRDNQWHYGREKGSLEALTPIHTNLTILSL